MYPKVYHQLATVEDTHWWHSARRRLIGSLLDGIVLDRRKRGLDVGCGTGGNIEFLKSYCSTVVGLDISEIALHLCRDKNHPDPVIRGDANLLSRMILPESFDLISIFHVLYHQWISDELDILTQAHTLLVPGGVIVITEPALDILAREHDRQTMNRKRFRLSQMEFLIRKAGFHVIAGTYFNSISFLPALILALNCRLPGRHATGDGDEIIKELRPQNRKINFLILKFMDIEREFIRRFRKMPFGISIAFVAKKPNDSDKRHKSDG